MDFPEPDGEGDVVERADVAGAFAEGSGDVLKFEGERCVSFICPMLQFGRANVLVLLVRRFAFRRGAAGCFWFRRDRGWIC